MIGALVVDWAAVQLGRASTIKEYSEAVLSEIASFLE
jgi:hypothetical protein